LGIRAEKESMVEDNFDKNKRKKLLINPDFQINFMKNMIFLNLVICGVFYAANAYFFWQGRQLGQEIGLTPGHVFFRFLDEQQRSMNIISLITMIVVSFGIVMFGLVYSNRIAGPIYRLQKYCRERAEGTEQGNLYFRKNDYFKEVADSINHFVYVSSNKNNSKKDSKQSRKAA
jgi:hypothetical protein